MKQLLEYIIPNIVNHPEEVVIEETSQDSLVNITIQTHPEDVGRVIGKSGKVIKAIRQIARIIAIKQGVRVNIDVLDTSGGKPLETQETSLNEASPHDPDLNSEEILSKPKKNISKDGIDLQTE